MDESFLGQVTTSFQSVMQEEVEQIQEEVIME
jgi:hypothetical protein